MKQDTEIWKPCAGARVLRQQAFDTPTEEVGRHFANVGDANSEESGFVLA